MIETGTRIGAYEVVRKLGEGGMGTVFLVRELATDKKFALKVANDDAGDELHQRFRQELKVTEKLQDLHLVAARETGSYGGKPYLVLEYLDGETLADAIDGYTRRGAVMPLLELLNIARQIAAGLGSAHAKEIVHRDIKPSNIFLCRTGATTLVKIIDFGLALIQRHTVVARGQPMLSPPYAPPEQWERWNEVDKSADIYAFGCTLFEMATGHPPFGTGGPLQRAHASQPPPPAGKVPRALRALVARMLAKDPKQRPSVIEVKQVLDAISHGDGGDSHVRLLPWLLIGAGGAGVIAVVATFAAHSCHSPTRDDARIADTRGSGRPERPIDAALPIDTAIAVDVPEPPPVPPDVEPPRPELDQAAILLGLRPVVAAIHSCYESALADEPGLRGTLTLEFDVVESGAVDLPQASGMNHAFLRACAIEALEHAAFRPPPARRHVRYPIALRSGAADAPKR